MPILDSCVGRRVEAGPNGPIVPEIKEIFPDAPFIARPGQINAWDNEDFVKAVKDTGSNHLPAYRNLITSYNAQKK